ncbi:Os05g0214001 [Oryza sativa Japonica Group]|uniref:Os05g0214001 protein n=1 Tax=Oryza sativa subsp. japonica TaxID=39947 RepID=A0A0P0WJN7_ORYSJ|nr:Os05g0214001 [Oryza sativa Japonica Group]
MTGAASCEKVRDRTIPHASFRWTWRWLRTTGDGRRRGLRATAAGGRGFARRQPGQGLPATAADGGGFARLQLAAGGFARRWPGQELLATAVDGGGFARRWPGEGLPAIAADGNDTDGGGFGFVQR